MSIIADPRYYWIARQAINISLNALGEPNRMQASVSAGANILCYIKGVKPASAGPEYAGNGDGLEYDAGHYYRSWPLRISPTFFNTNTPKYVYAAIPRSASVGSEAQIVFPSEKLDIWGRTVDDPGPEPPTPTHEPDYSGFQPMMAVFRTVDGVSIPTGSTLETYLRSLYGEAYMQYYYKESLMGLPALYRQSNFPSVYDYYGDVESDDTFAVMAAWLTAMVLAELVPTRRNALYEKAYNYCGIGKDVPTFSNTFSTDHNVARMVASILYGATRKSTKIGTMRTEAGGSTITYHTSIYDVLVDSTSFMPPAAGPYLSGYDVDGRTGTTPRGNTPGGYPVGEKDASTKNLKADLRVHQYVSGMYSLTSDIPAVKQRTVQAIADKEHNLPHLFGSGHSVTDPRYGLLSFLPVFGEHNLGFEIPVNGAIAALVSAMAAACSNTRETLLHQEYGRRRPGQGPADGTRNDDPAQRVLVNYAIEESDGNTTGYYSPDGTYTYDQNADYDDYEEYYQKKVSANSYPSGHSSYIFGIAVALAEVMPDKADIIMKAANDFALSRVITRYHWTSDTIHGRVIGSLMVPVEHALTNIAYASLLEAAKAEYASLKAAAATTSTRGAVATEETDSTPTRSSSSRQLGSEDYFYIWLQGIISSSGDDGKTARTWEQEINTGTLATDEAMAEIGDERFISKLHEDETYFLVKFFAGLVADKLIQSPDWQKGAWYTDDRGKEVNDGSGFAIWNDGISSWNIEIDYATVRHLMRAAEIYTQAAHIGEVNNQAVFNQGLQTLGNILLGHYHEGVEGGIITPEGDAEIKALVTRGLAKLQELFVVDNAKFGGNLSSLIFDSGFLGGKGWAIQKKTRINAAGEPEDYYVLEIDSVTVRSTLRVYELVVSQLRGEFDNYLFSSCMEVHHYDPVTGKLWLSTDGEKVKAVPYRKDDCILCQQYLPENDVAHGGTGYITKAYEFIVTEVGTGGMEDEDGYRMDWLRFTNFSTTMEGGTPLTLIAKRDTICRLDNLTDPERKGIMQIITVGPNTPYLDVHYGMKTDPENSHRVRIGNLTGKLTEEFGWLEGFGAYINNLYGVGTIMNCQTGENVQGRFEVASNYFRSTFKETTYLIGDNLVANGEFQSGLEKWTLDNPYGSGNPSSGEQMVFGDGDGMLMVNGEQLATQYTAKSELTEYSGIRVLRINGCGVQQKWSDMVANGTHDEIKNSTVGTPNYDAESESYYDGMGLTPAQIQQRINAAKAANAAIEAAAEETVSVPDKLYLGVRMWPLSSGRLKVTLVSPDGTVQTLYDQNVNMSVQFQLFQSMDSQADPWLWDTSRQDGFLRVEYSGECLLRFVSIQNDPVSDQEAEFSTLFEQTSRVIRLQAMKETADHRQAYAQIDIKYNEISSVVSNNKQLTDNALQELSSDLDKEIAARKAADGTQDDTFATYQRQTDSAIHSIAGHWDSDGHLIGYSTTIQTADMISSGVATANSNAQQYVAALKGLIDTDVLKDSGDAYATFKTQTSNFIGTIAGQFDASGNLVNYSTTSQTATMIKNTVESYGYLKSTDAATIYSTKSELEQTASSITSRVSAIETSKKAIDDPNGWRQGKWSTSNPVQHVESSKHVRYAHLLKVTSGTKFYLNPAYTLTVVFMNSGSYITNIGKPGTNKGALDITVPINADSAYIFVGNTSNTDLAVNQVTSFGLMYTENNIMTEANLNLYVEDAVSWITASADNIIFNFTKRWQVKANGSAVMDLDTEGNLKITGKLTEGATIDTAATTDGRKIGTTMNAFKAVFVEIPSGNTEITRYISWSSGATHIITGSHTNGWCNIGFPALASVRSALGINDETSFVVELNIINLSSYDYIRLRYSTTTGQNTIYPRFMNYNNEAAAGDNAVLQMGKGDYVKVLLVYHNNYYNAYTIIRKDDGWY